MNKIIMEKMEFYGCSLVQKLRLRIKKPEAPVSGIFDYFGAEIERERNA